MGYLEDQSQGKNSTCSSVIYYVIKKANESHSAVKTVRIKLAKMAILF
jgi:hypothetical protein